MDRKHAEVLTYHHWSQSRWAQQAMDEAKRLGEKNYELELQARNAKAAAGMQRAFGDLQGAANALQTVMRNMREGNYND